MSKPPAKLGTPPPPAKQSDGKTRVWAAGFTPPQDWIDRQKRRDDFVGYLLVGGPLDGDMMSFVNNVGERPIIRLQSTPRPGWPPRSTTGDVSSIEEYRAEFMPTVSTGSDPMRFYRHASITFAQAVNRLLLWYLPPETRPSLDAQAVQDLAAQMERDERAQLEQRPDPDQCEHVFEPCLREREFGASRTIEKRCRNCHQWEEP